jgi:hypothetical protein
LATNFNNVIKEIENGLPSVIADPEELEDEVDHTFEFTTGPWKCRTCHVQ